MTITTTDFNFSFEGADALRRPLAHLQVVRFQGRESLSGLYRYELILLIKIPAPIPTRTSSSASAPPSASPPRALPAYKLVYGIFIEAEDVNAAPTACSTASCSRRRSRARCTGRGAASFLEKTTRALLDAVLESEPSLTRADGATVEEHDGDVTSFTPAEEQFTWRLTDIAHVDDHAVRPYCVQTNLPSIATPVQLLSLDRPDRFLAWNTRLDADADFLPLDPLTLHYLGQQVGLCFSRPSRRAPTAPNISRSSSTAARSSSDRDLRGALRRRHARGRVALARYLKPHLVVDEVGYLTYGDAAANVLLQVVNEQHIKKRAMLSTTNKHPKRWGAVLHDDDLADAIVDRSLHRRRLLRLDGPSVRTKHLPEGELRGEGQDEGRSRRVSRTHTSSMLERPTPPWGLDAGAPMPAMHT